LFRLNCSKKDCQNKFSIDCLQHALDPFHFEKISYAITRRVLKVSEAFVECPNAECSNFGFYVSENDDGESFNDINCGLPFECGSCGHAWCTAA
jgi:hypothetical protein